MFGVVLVTTSRSESRNMFRQAGVAWLLILLQAAMFWYMSETVLFPIVVVLIATPAVWWRRRWELSSTMLPWIDLAVVVGCSMRWYLAPYEPPTMMTFLSYPMIHASAQFFLLAQVVRVWARRPDRTLPIYLPFLAVLVFVCLGDVYLSRYGRMRRMHQRATVALVGLSCAYYATARRRQQPQPSTQRWVRPVSSAAVLTACTVATYAGNSFLLERWAQIENWVHGTNPHRYAPRRSNIYVGFSGQAPLGSMQLLRSTLDEEVALRVISDSPPGYLRGAVFERYTSQGWEWHNDWLPAVRTRKPLPLDSGEALANQIAPPNPSPVFPLRVVPSAELQPVTIWRSPSMDKFTFLPLATSKLEAPTETLFFDRHTVVMAESIPSEASLTAWVPQARDARVNEPIVQPPFWELGAPWALDRLETMNAKVRLRQLPRRLTDNPQLQKLATQIFANCQTPRDKVAAVQRHFSAFHYGTSIEVPPGFDPVLYFLTEQPAAHCEFFASSTAVLLRMAGVPCRYVTGYVGGDYSLLGKYWVVRQRDAHAWVEAFLPDEGWVVVDCTPGDHVPTARSSFSIWQLWDEITLRGQMIRTALAAEGWTSKWRAIKLFVQSVLTTVPGILVVGGLLFLAVRNLRFTRRSSHQTPTSAELLELQKLLAEFDRRLRRWQLERDVHETLHQFAHRVRDAAASRPVLRDVAEWYLRYAAARYDSETATDASHTLRTELQSVCARL